MSSMSAIRFATCTALLTCSSPWTVGCEHEVRERPRPVSAAPTLHRYHPGRWRLTTWNERDRTVLFLSHLVIRHRGSDPNALGAMRPLTWRPDAPPPARSRDDALRVALTIAGKAMADPSSFGELAVRHSEDEPTRAQGGSLGGVRATQLPAAYLDAIAELAAGEVSQLFETGFGFHLVLLRSPPAEALIAGRHIVIRYEGTAGGRAGSESRRSRAEALTLAERIAVQARSGNATFEALVRAHSEHVDAVQGGDMGEYSVRDPGGLPRQIDKLASLAPGAVSDPLETVFGFEVLQRTQAEVRPPLAMSAIRIKFDPTLEDGAEFSRAYARTLASELARRVQSDPSSFEAMQREHCCEGMEVWTRGRGLPEVSPVVERLAIGEIAMEPVESGWFYVLPRRVDPAIAPSPPPLRYELPAPREPDFEALMREGQGEALAEGARQLLASAQRGLPLRREALDEVQQALDELAAALERSPDQRDAAQRTRALAAMQARLRAALNSEEFAMFQRFMIAWAEQAMLAQVRL